MSQLAGDRIRAAVIGGVTALDDTADVGGLLWDNFSSVHAALASGAEVDCTFSGATATLSVLQGRKLTSAWVGDSRAVLGRREEGTVRAYDLTNDHKPDLPEEHARIAQAGGRVEPLLVRPRHGAFGGAQAACGTLQRQRGLGVSRSLPRCMSCAWAASVIKADRMSHWVLVKAGVPARLCAGGDLRVP